MESAATKVRAQESRLASRRSYLVPRILIGALVAAVLAVLVVLAILPFYMTVIASLKFNRDLFKSPLGLPPTVSWASYKYILQSGFMRNIANTIVINIISLSLITVMGSLAAFALARLRIPGRNQIRLGIISCLMIPVYAVVFPVYAMLDKWQLTDGFVSVIGPYVGFGLPFAIFVLHGYMKTIPSELDEAAVIDGATPFQILRHVVFPLCKPALAAVLIFEAVWIWNEVPFALVLIRKESMMTLAVGLLKFGTNWGIDWPKTLSAVAMVSFPIIIFYLLLSDYFIKGLTAGAIKE